MEPVLCLVCWVDKKVKGPREEGQWKERINPGNGEFEDGTELNDGSFAGKNNTRTALT